MSQLSPTPPAPTSPQTPANNCVTAPKKIRTNHTYRLMKARVPACGRPSKTLKAAGAYRETSRRHGLPDLPEQQRQTMLKTYSTPDRSATTVLVVRRRAVAFPATDWSELPNLTVSGSVGHHNSHVTRRGFAPDSFARWSAASTASGHCSDRRGADGHPTLTVARQLTDHRPPRGSPLDRCSGRLAELRHPADTGFAVQKREAAHQTQRMRSGGETSSSNLAATPLVPRRQRCVSLVIDFP